MGYSGYLRVVVIIIFLVLDVHSQTKEASVFQQVFLAKQLIPTLKVIAVVTDVDQKAELLKEIKRSCDAYQIQLLVFDVKKMPDLYKTFLGITPGKVDLVWMVDDAFTRDKFGRRFYQETCIKKKIPLFSYSQEHVREGALFTVLIEADGTAKIYFNPNVAKLLEMQPPPNTADKLVMVQ